MCAPKDNGRQKFPKSTRHQILLMLEVNTRNLTPLCCIGRVLLVSYRLAGLSSRTGRAPASVRSCSLLLVGAACLGSFAGRDGPRGHLKHFPLWRGRTCPCR